MKALIIEDETAAAKNLLALLACMSTEVEVLEVIDTVVDSVEWLKLNPQPDLIFMDIHLADGEAFSIFERVAVSAPIIFTTAYDQYALEAFKVNSIDYLLKPIKSGELSRALDKFMRFSFADVTHYVERQSSVLAPKTRSFLIPVRDKLMPLAVEEVAYFYTFEEKVEVVNLKGDKFPIDKALDVLMKSLPEEDFFRANRQFIVSRSSIKDLSVWFGRRLSLNLKVPTPERVIISKARVSDFKKWFVE